MTAHLRPALLALLLALALVAGASRPVVFEDGSVQFFDRPGWSVCLPGQLCDEE